MELILEVLLEGILVLLSVFMPRKRFASQKAQDRLRIGICLFIPLSLLLTIAGGFSVFGGGSMPLPKLIGYCFLFAPLGILLLLLVLGIVAVMKRNRKSKKKQTDEGGRLS